MKMANRNPEKGFTLVEVLITLVVSSIVMAGIYSAFKTQQDSYIAQNQVVEAQQNIRAGLYILTHEIRMAGFDPTLKAAAGITTATRSRFSFTKDDNLDGDTADNSESVSIGFKATDDADLDGIVDDLNADGVQNDVASLGRDIGGGFQPVTDNIQAIEFYYRLADGTWTLSPTVTQLPEISAVQISILARTAHPDRKYTDATPYSLESGTIWGPFDDHYRRRFQTATVVLPNMGL